MGKYSLLKPIFIGGFAMPYLYLSFNSNYINYLYLLLQGSISLNLLSIPSIIGLLSLIIYAGKPLLWSINWYRSIFN
jgi:hypothetical protein